MEKLLASYGFIQCCERQARLFFHYSQFSGTIEHLKLGDPVEFEMTYDRRTGKPIASRVVKIRSEAPIDDGSGFVDNSKEQLSNGFITTEPSASEEGRVAYENQGECFFLPFTPDEVEPGTILRAKDKVTFRLVTDKAGNLRARNLALIQSTPDQYQGIVCTKKDTFGFIERADIVREIFFHSTACDDFKSLNVGDEVSFQTQTRNDKKVAVSLRILPKGSVVFEDVSSDRYSGFITRMPDKFISNTTGRPRYSSSAPSLAISYGSGNNSITPAPESGVIKYQICGQEEEIFFALKDINGEFTVKKGDLVTFNFVTDRRDGVKHAGRIELHENCFNVTNEPREQGYIASIKDAYGFIKFFNREGTKVYFKLTEVLDPNYQININDEVEFTLTQDISSPGKMQASRIRFLPNGTILQNVLSKSDNSSNNCVIPVASLPVSSNPHMASGYDYPLIDLGTDDSCNFAASNQSSSVKRNEFSGLTQGNAICSDTWSAILSTIPLPSNNCNNPSDKNTFVNGHVTSAYGHADLMSFRSKTSRPDHLIVKLKAPAGSNNAKVILVRRPRGPDGTKGFNETKQQTTSTAIAGDI